MAEAKLSRRPLGQTGMMVSPLGLGTVKFGRNEKLKYAAGFDLPDEKFLADFLARARGYGINLIDTAPSYGLAEARLGRLLKNQRQDWVIAGKAGEEFENGESHYDFSAAAITASAERSLQRLQTDYLDVLLLHATEGDEKLLEDEALLRALQDLKQAGKVRAVGLSTYSIAAGLRAAEIFDVLMVSYNLAFRAEAPVIAKAAENGAGVLIKKAFNSGKLEGGGAPDPIPATYELLFSQPGISAAIIGSINPQHLDENARKLAAIYNDFDK